MHTSESDVQSESDENPDELWESPDSSLAGTAQSGTDYAKL